MTVASSRAAAENEGEPIGMKRTKSGSSSVITSCLRNCCPAQRRKVGLLRGLHSEACTSTAAALKALNSLWPDFKINSFASLRSDAQQLLATPDGNSPGREGLSNISASQGPPGTTDMAAPQPSPRGAGMSLYANLLDPKADSSASISRAPVLFKQPGAAGDSGDGASAKKPADPCWSPPCGTAASYSGLTPHKPSGSNLSVGLSRPSPSPRGQAS